MMNHITGAKKNEVIEHLKELTTLSDKSANVVIDRYNQAVAMYNKGITSFDKALKECCPYVYDLLYSASNWDFPGVDMTEYKKLQSLLKYG